MYLGQAIVTKYLGPTYHRGSRVKASCQAGSVTVHWDHTVGVYENHYAAALKLCEKLDWLEYGRLYGAGLPDDAGYVFVQIRDEAKP